MTPAEEAAARLLAFPKHLPPFFVAPAEGGTKADAGKPPMELLDAYALEQIALVLEFGRVKYAAHNWKAGLKFSRLIGAALRHTFAILRGEELDPESSLPHAAHLGCCAMFLIWTMRYRPDLDDRHKQ